ncbi:hypothetical protein HPB49_012254 [Dermacentor silvarum]|uniref:Uncharacterized protein n=1 Tax=Dermacentor silvarum TaxID=543639 RepID=A0ACB8CXC6_DERSI|nr:hypothetical protein HPB49_012254 [Dermacentor silvarum]
MKHVRGQIDAEYDDWFQTAEELALSVDTCYHEASASWVSAQSDHVIQEMDSRFPKSNRVGLALLQLLPSAVTSVDLKKLRNDLVFWEIDLRDP